MAVEVKELDVPPPVKRGRGRPKMSEIYRAAKGKTRGVSTKELTQYRKKTLKGFEAENYRKNRPELFCKLQEAAIAVQLMVLESITPEEVKAYLPHHKAGVIQATAMVAGIAFDKERLLMGQSTQNVAILSKVQKMVESKTEY